MRQAIKWCSGVVRHLFRDKRPEHVIRQEEEFIAAVNKLKTLRVTDSGGMSIDPEEIRDQITETRAAYKHLIDPAHRRSAQHQDIQNKQGPQSMTAPKRPNQKSTDPHSDYIELVTWRHLSGGASIKYVCLQSLGTLMFSVAATRYFPNTHNVTESGSATHQVAERIKSSADGVALAWFSTLQEAMDAYDASF
ncbi:MULTISPECIES: hypothetical protein [Pseudomonas]|uniref:hypothetical protein n=1 Tax=Pseudomonas TaxID=286 RepID=UPI0015BB91B5|nr:MULTISPECIES: hypothetical protein [Pseudomonas]